MADRRLITALAIGLAAVLPACAPGSLSERSAGSPYAPGVTSGDGVDGLIVGHRLMEAGEYELALEAYYRGAAEQGLTTDVLSALGSANLRLGRLGQAETLLRRAIAQDKSFVPAWNNLGVVLLEQGKTGEAARTFKTAYALDSGESVEIRDNLRLALARLEDASYSDADRKGPALVRRGTGEYLLLTTPPA